MRKGKSVIGKDVLSLEDGVKLETVSDLVIDPEGRRVVAILVTEGGFLSSSKVVPTEQVASYGKDAVIVRSNASVVSVSDHPDLRGMVDHHNGKIIGKKVFTSSGDDQGSISDIYFDKPTGAVVGYEVSGGLLGDVAKGTSYLGTDEITSIGKEVIFVPPEVAETLDSQVGGLQGAVKDAGDKLGEASNGASGANPQDALVGKRTGSEVTSPAVPSSFQRAGASARRTSRPPRRQASLPRSRHRSRAGPPRPSARMRPTPSVRSATRPRTCGISSPPRSAR